MKVLITEDEEFLLTAIEFRLKKEGYEAVFAENSTPVVASIQNTKPDLLILGLDSPNLNARELITNLQQNDQPIPIIIIGTMEQRESILELMRLGASDFLTKPFKPAELVLRVKNIFQEKGLESL